MMGDVKRQKLANKDAITSKDVKKTGLTNPSVIKEHGKAGKEDLSSLIKSVKSKTQVLQKKKKKKIMM